MFTHYFSHSYCKNSCVSLLVGKTTFTCSQVHSWWILLLSKNQFEQNNSLECAFYTDRFENGEFKYLLVWGWLYGSHVDTKNRSVSPTTGKLALFLCKFCDTKIIVLVCQQTCMVALSRSCKVFLRYINVVWVRKWMHKKPFSRSEIQFLTLTKGMVVFNNYLRFQESLPLIFYNVRGQPSLCMLCELVSHRWGSTFLCMQISQTTTNKQPNGQPLKPRCWSSI